MSKTLSISSTPTDSAGLTGILFRGINTLIQAFANNHKASHWPFLMSAPYTTDMTLTGTTGGTQTSSTTVRVRVVYVTPNGATKYSSEFSVALTGGQNATWLDIPAVDAEYTPYAYVFVTISAAATGQPCYKLRGGANDEIAWVSGSGGSVAADGKVTLSTTGTTRLILKKHGNNTQDAHTVYATNASGSQDPLRLAYIPETEAYSYSDDGTSTTVTRTVTLNGGGTLTEIGVYTNLTRQLSTKSIKIGSVTVARFGSYTYDASTGNCTGFSQTEA